MQSLINFALRHKKKFIALLLLGFGGMGGYVLVKRALLAKMSEISDMGKQMESRRRKESELARLKNECTTTITTFLSPLRRQLNRLTDVMPITTQLKELRAKQKGRKATRKEKDEEDVLDDGKLEVLWEDLKVKSLARLIASVYALTLMDLLLRVQLHVAAKTALEEREKSGGEIRVTQKVREQFMFKATDFFVSQGLTTLLQRVEQGIRKATKAWMMGSDSEVTQIQVTQMIDSIRLEIEGAGAKAGDLSASARTWFLLCLIQPDEALAKAREEAGLDAAQAEGLKGLLDETMDMLESPHFAGVLEEALNTIFATLMEDLRTKQFEVKKSDIPATVVAATSTPVEGGGGVVVATAATAPTMENYILAKVIVGIKLYSKHVLSSTEADGEEGDDAVTTDTNRYVSKLEALPALEELSRAIMGLTGDDAMTDLQSEMKNLLPLLASMGGGGGEGGMPGLGGALGGGPGGQPDFAAMMAMLQQQAGAPPTGAGPNPALPAGPATARQIE